MKRGLCYLAALVTLGGCGSTPLKKGEVFFTDVTAAAGVDFSSVGGANLSFVLDLMGAGAVLLDFDGDEDLDIFCINGSAFEGFGADPPPTNALYENQGDWTFREVGKQAGIASSGWGMGAVAADYDNDGDVDIYLTRWGSNILYRNEGNGTFFDVTEEAGVGDRLWGAGACFLDHDGDGDLDLYVVNYLGFKHTPGEESTLAAKLGLKWPALPHEFAAQDNLLYRNNGDGTFTDVTKEAGAADHGGKGLGVVAFDYDEDGDLDLYIANDTTRNSLLQNQGDGTFVDRGLVSGAAYDGYGAPEGSMGLAVGDVDGDGHLDLLVTNFAHEGHTLYQNHGDGTLTDVSVRAGLLPKTLGGVGWGVDLFDYDCDGDVDIFFAQGHLLGGSTMSIIRTITPDGYLPGTMTTDAFRGGYPQPNRLFQNDGSGYFQEVSDLSGDHFRKRHVSRGAAFGDLDADGDIDIVIINKNAPALLLRNDGGDRRGWIQVALRGTHCNRSAVGARVELWIGERRQVRGVRAGSSYIGQNSLDVHFGIGEASRVDRLVVRWPCGAIQVVEDPPLRKRISISEPPGPSERRRQRRRQP